MTMRVGEPVGNETSLLSLPMDCMNTLTASTCGAQLENEIVDV
jgi:hypothetical protein